MKAIWDWLDNTTFSVAEGIFIVLAVIVLVLWKDIKEICRGIKKYF